MSGLVRLYPRSWRARYEPEFLDLLETRPPSVRDRIDIVRGAIDARLDAGSPCQRNRETRLAAAAAIAAGVLWVAWLTISIRAVDVLDPAPVRDLGRWLSLLAGLGLAASHLSLGQVSLGGVSAFGGGPAAVLGLVASMGLAAAIAGRSLPSWIGVGWVVATVLVMAAFYGLVASHWTDPSTMEPAIAYGIAWIVIGLTVLLRGVPTRVADDASVGSGG